MPKSLISLEEEIRKIDPVLADKMVPECLYRGFCPEFINPCGYSKTEKYKKDLEEYKITARASIDS